MTESPAPVRAPSDILVLGEPMVEFNQTGAQEGRLYLQGFGGDVSNFAIAAARQGARAGVISALGDDEPGRALRALWRREGVGASAVRTYTRADTRNDTSTDAQAPTGIYFVSHDAQGHHFSFHRSGSAASRILPADLDAAQIAGARLLHLSGITLAISASSHETALAAVHIARAAGVNVSFDTNLRLKLWPSAAAAARSMNEFMCLCDICLPSLDDMTTMTGLTDPDAIVDHCLALGAKIVALKLGAAGALVADATQRHRIAPHPCDCVDATGAGDTFGGAFAARWLAGDSLRDAGRYAAVAAALSTQGFGAVEPIPHADAVRAALQR